MVRRYQPGDHPSIARIFHQAIHRLACRHYTPAQLHAWAGEKDWLTRCENKQPFVKIHDGKVVGFIELDPDGHIDCCFVDPGHAG
ncbi:MAG: GNAT family N-acetyltransferase, partial [Verrucomicrobiaceae bacterium]